MLEMPSENRQSQGRGNMGGQLIPDLGCSGWKRFWSGHWCFLQWCRYGYRRGRPEWSWWCVPWKNLSKVQRLLVVQYLESSCGNFEIDSMAYREPVLTGQNCNCNCNCQPNIVNESEAKQSIVKKPTVETKDRPRRVEAYAKPMTF